MSSLHSATHCTFNCQIVTNYKVIRSSTEQVDISEMGKDKHASREELAESQQETPSHGHSSGKYGE